MIYSRISPFSATVVMVMVFKVMAMIYMPSSWLTLIAVAMVMVGVGAVIHVVIMTNKEEKQKIINKLRKNK